MSEIKTFSRRIAEGVAWYAGVSVLLKIIGFVFTLLLVSKLSLQEYGTYQLTLAAYSLLSTFLLGGLDQVVIAEGSRLIGKGETQQAKHLGLSLGLFFLPIGVALWAAAFFAPYLFSRWYSNDILSMLPTLSWIFLAVPLNRIMQYSFSVRQKFSTINLFLLAEEFFKLALTVLLVFFLGHRVHGVIIATGIAYTAATFIALPLFVGWYRDAWSGVTIKPIIHLFKGIGKWVIAQKAIRQFEKSCRPFIIQFFVGREGVALFSVAEKLLLYLITLIPTDDVLVPALAAETGNWDRLHRVLERGIKYSVPFFTLITIGAFLFSGPFLALFFPQYVPSLPLLHTLLLYVPFSGIAYVLSSFYVSHHEQKELFFLIVIRFLSFIVIAPVLLITLGAAGIAWEYIITLMTFNALRYASLVRRHPELQVSLSGLFQIDAYDRHAWQRILAKLTRR